MDDNTHTLGMDAVTSGLEVPTLKESVSEDSADRALGRGRMVGRYLILRTLGVGGIGMVFLADDPELDRKVALKLLRSGDRDTAEGRAHLLAEAQAIARLSHPNVVAVYDVGMFEGGVFLAMEFVEGPSMRRWLDTARSVDEILDVMLAAGRGLAAAHEADLVHRDIKPENILVADDGRTRVVDFGLAQLQAEPSLTSSRISWRSNEWEESSDDKSEVMGTPRYMAPELFNHAEATPRSDQFAFCVTLYEALHGVPPFPPLPGHRRKRDFARPATGSDAHKLPGTLRAVLERGLALEPEQRYRDMNELIAALAQVRQRKRRRLTIAGAAAVMGAGIAIGLAPGQLQQERPCAHAADEIDEVWTPRAQTAIADAFEATGLPHASQAATDVQRTLEGFAEQWRSAREDVCMATLDGTQSGATMDLKISCLEQRRLHLAALIETFEGADTQVVDNAAVAARSLPRVTECNDDRVLAQLPPTPSDPQLRARVSEQRELLATVTAARRAGQLKSALELAEPLAEPIAEIGYAPLEAELSLELGMTHAALGHHTQAEQHLRATLIAATRGRYELVRGEAWLELARELSAGQKRFEAGEEAARAAAASLAGRGEDPKTHERLLLVQAQLASARDDRARVVKLLSGLLERDDLVIERHELLAQLGISMPLSSQGIPLLQEALELRQQSLGPEHPRVADVMLSLSKRLADSEEFDAAMEVSQKAHAIRRKLFDHNTVAFAATINSFAYVEAARGQSEQAVRHFEQAAEMIRNDPNHVEFDLATALSNIGVIYSRIGRHAEARQHHKQALEIYERTDPEHPRILLPLMNTAAAYGREGLFEQAIEWDQKAIAWLLNDPRSSFTLVELELEVAEMYLDIGNLDESRRTLARAEARLELLTGGRTSRNFHQPLQVRARLLLLEGDHVAALAAAEDSVRRYEMEDISNRERSHAAWARFFYAQALHENGRTDEAIPQAHAAIDGLRGTRVQRQRTMVETWLADNALPPAPAERPSDTP